MNAALLLTLLLSAAPKVDAVVVFPDRALVTRTASAACQGGLQRVGFGRIPPAADPATVRAKVTGGVVEGVTVDERPGTVSFGAEQQALKLKVREQEAEVSRLEDDQRRAETRAARGDRYAELALADIGEEMTAPRPNVAAWTRALDLALQARLEAAAERAKVEGELQRATERLKESKQRLEQLAAAAPPSERVAEVLVRCERGEARVELTYLVGGAAWTPSYEARADEVKGAVELTTVATVVQATGEDWTGAAVTLSTAVPSEDATVPELRPLRVSATERNIHRKVLVRRDEVVQRAEAASAAPSPSGGLRAVAQGLSVQLLVPGKSDVPGNATPVRLVVGTTRLAASFAYRAAPKVMPVVFRVADVVNTAPYPLLPGVLDAYRKSGFIGRYVQERVAEGAPFHITFGPEEQLRVKRLVKHELKKDEGLFNLHHRFLYAYEFQLESYLPGTQTVELTEHVPVSELDDVKVELEKDGTTAGYQLAKDDGLASWKVQLETGQKKAVGLAFHVDVPTSYDIGAL